MDRRKIWLKNDWLNILLIIIIGTLLRVPLYHTPFWRTNDTMEYINIARNLDEGRGLTQSIKFHLYDPTPVVTSALRSRPPLTSLILAGLLKINNDFYFLQIFNLFLGIFNAIFVYLLARRFFGTIPSLVGGLLAVTNPNILITGRLVLSDQLFATFSLLPFLIFYLPIKHEFIKYILLGISCALLALTRLEGMALLLIFVVFSLKKPKEILLMIGAFLVVMLPYFWTNWVSNGSPLFNKNGIHYQVFDVSTALGGGFEKVFPAPIEFIKANFVWVAKKVAITTFLNFASLFEFGYFGPTVIFLVLALRRSWKKHLPWFLFSLAVLMLYNSLWSATFERSRHFIYLYLLLLFPILDYLHRNLTRPIIILLVAVTFLANFLFDAHRIIWARTVDPTVSVWDYENKRELFSWIEKNTPPEVIIASTNPFMVNLQTDRPGVAIPTNLTKENLPRFIDKFHISYFLIINEDHLDIFFQSYTKVADLSDGRIFFVKR